MENIFQSWFKTCSGSDIFQETKQIVSFEYLFNNAPVVCSNWQKHWGMFLNESLNFSYHIKEKTFKAMKGTGTIKKLSKTLPWHSLITIYNISHKWDLTFIMVILFRVSQIMIVSIKKLKEFSTIRLLQLQLPSK